VIGIAAGILLISLVFSFSHPAAYALKGGSIMKQPPTFEEILNLIPQEKLILIKL